MSDPVDPVPPPPPFTPVSPASEGPHSSTGLPSNIAAALACIPLIGGIIFYVLEKQDSFVRYYALQSIILGGAWVLFLIFYSVAVAILTPIPGIGFVFGMFFWIVRLVVGLVFLVLWGIATIKAFTNVRWEIPYIGPVARKQFPNAAV
jgi:uncharacterized membrane protein